MFYPEIILQKARLLYRWWGINFGWQLKRIWRDFPQTTRDPIEKESRRRQFREAMRHEWGSIKNHQLLDWLYGKDQQTRREAGRWWNILNHPQAGTRKLADLYRARS